jgi:hypothetical protein
MGKAIHIEEDQAIESAGVDSAIQDARFAKSRIFVTHVLDGMRKSRRPALEQWRVGFARAVIGDDDLKM